MLVTGMKSWDLNFFATIDFSGYFSRQWHFFHARGVINHFLFWIRFAARSHEILLGFFLQLLPKFQGKSPAG